MKKLSLAPLLLGMTGLVLWLPFTPTVAREGAAYPIGATLPAQTSPCFAEDPGIGSTNKDQHFSWAQRQDSDFLARNLSYKIRLLFDCAAVDGEKLANAFADISVIIANRVSNPACFNGDAAVLDRDRAAHERWARTKTRNDVRDNLRWKAASAVNCLDRNAQNAYFADVSVAVARVPSASGSTGGGGGSGACRENSRVSDPFDFYHHATVYAGRPFQFEMLAPRGTNLDDAWVGIFAERDSTVHIGTWMWVKDMKNCRGTLMAPPIRTNRGNSPGMPDTYELRLFLDRGYDKMATAQVLYVYP